MILALLACLQQLEPESPAARVEGAGMWLFVVDGPVLSMERDQKLFIGRQGKKVDWKEVASGIADHWHIFAHGHHWISCSAPSARQLRLLQLDGAFKKVREVELETGSLPTNDHFLVADGDGVAVGVFDPGRGHRVFRVGRGEVDLGGGKHRHSNGSSAIPVKDGFLLFASETLNPAQPSRVFLMEFDAAWKITSSRTLIEEPKTHVSMASGAKLDDGTLVVVARVGGEDGAIVRYISGKREVLEEKGANRPHVVRIGDQLYTTWDVRGGGAKLQIDRVRK